MKNIKRTGAALMAALVLTSVLADGCTNKNGPKEIKDESGLVLSGTMPDKLPDGLSWYDFTEDTALFEYLTETVGGYFISDITWYADHTWVFFTETEPQKAVYHIMSFDKDYTADCNFVIRDEFGDNISLDSMVLGDRLYIEAYDFASHEQYLYPIDENNGSIAPDNRIVLTKQSQEYESPNRFAFVGNDVAILKQENTTSVELVDPSAGTVKNRISVDNLASDFNIRYPEGILCAGNNKVVVWGSTSANYNFGQTRYCLVDLETGKIRALDEMEYINIPRTEEPGGL